MSAPQSDSPLNSASHALPLQSAMLASRTARAALSRTAAVRAISTTSDQLGLDKLGITGNSTSLCFCCVSVTLPLTCWS